MPARTEPNSSLSSISRAIPERTSMRRKVPRARAMAKKMPWAARVSRTSRRAAMPLTSMLVTASASNSTALGWSWLCTASSRRILK
ncbi:hypothetical protein D3C85_1487150 [compost metagenome]